MRRTAGAMTEMTARRSCQQLISESSGPVTGAS